MEIKDLEKIAFGVRQKIEDQLIKTEYLKPELTHFPESSCEVSTQILGLYLKIKGVENVVACRGKRTNPNKSGEQTHVWLIVNDNIIMDITSDQFSDSSSKVFVGENSKFHSTFLSVEQRKISEEALARRAGMGYEEFFQAVIKNLEAA